MSTGIGTEIVSNVSFRSYTTKGRSYIIYKDRYNYYLMLDNGLKFFMWSAGVPMDTNANKLLAILNAYNRSFDFSLCYNKYNSYYEYYYKAIFKGDLKKKLKELKKFTNKDAQEQIKIIEEIIPC